jgi:tetratricopeptide (TPR) repeat protein
MFPALRPRTPGAGDAGAILVALLLAFASEAAGQARVTFNKDVAPIVFEHCVACHRPGEIAPFSLLSYQDARPHAAAIVRAVRNRDMPPWKPVAGYGPGLAGARLLSAAEIATIERWVAGNAVEGDASDLPGTPAFVEGWQLGQPDLIVTMQKAYEVSAGRADFLRSFVIPIPTDRMRYVRGIEFRPGNARMVHHANLRIDSTGAARRLDEADREPGFDGFVVAGNFPDGHFLGWTPGQVAPLLPEDMAWRLPPGSDLVVQLHINPGTSPEAVQPSIGLFFTDRPPARTPLMIRLGRHDIDIAPGARNHVAADEYVLPVDVEVRGLQPHAHYRAREIRGKAILPDGRERWLIFIRDWDFNWQDVYRFSEPVSLPRGTALKLEVVYDNSAANRRNPDRPPRRIRWGESSADEMGDLWIQVLTRSADDRARLAADVGPKVMAADAAGYEKMIEVDPRNARLHEAAAAIYLSLGGVDAAGRHLREALRIAPDSVEAHYNLASALARQRRPNEAIEHLRRVVELEPQHVAAHANLGAVLRSQQRLDEASEELIRALALDPSNAVAHTNLAGILAERDSTAEAIAHYRQALDTNPDVLEALTNLSWILATHRDQGVRNPADAVRLADRAAALSGRTDVRALDTLAAALAAAGDFEQAVSTVQTAIMLAQRSGSAETVRQLQERLDLYRRKTPLYAASAAPR